MVEKNKVDEMVMMGIAAQLRKPAGEYALKTGEMMNRGNAEINKNTLTIVAPCAGDVILEIGMGNGKLVREIFSICAELQYTGYDYSEAMVNEAIRNNSELIKADKASFVCGSADEMSFDDNRFDKLFTVNTLYFWDEREKILSEIERVLKPKGKLIIAIRPEHEMSHYPMTQWGFKMYSTEQLRDFLENNGWTVEELVEIQEPMQDIAGQMMPVSSLIVKVSKIKNVQY